LALGRGGATSSLSSRLPPFSSHSDTGSIYNGLTWSDPTLNNLVLGLTTGAGAPAFIRIGGTAADYSYYIPDAPSTDGGNAHTIINTAVLDQIVAFSKKTGSSILWDFNGLTFRNQTTMGPWDPTANATAMLQYLSTTYPGELQNWAFSLGNEPEFWPSKATNYTQLGLDAATLKTTLKSYSVGQDVFGPSFGGITNPTIVQEYMVASRGAIKGLTVHNYPMARDCTIPAYVNARQNVLGMGSHLAVLAALKPRYADPDLLLVLEETAGSYGGGCENITDRFASGFFYMPALGVTAASGFNRLHRQDIVGWSFTGGMSHYQLVGAPGWTNVSSYGPLTPHPDWFTSVLFEELVGTALLNSTVSGDAFQVANVSAFAWCPGAPSLGTTSLVLTLTNPTGMDVTVNVVGDNINAAPRTEYILTSSPAAYAESRARLAAGALRTTPETAVDPPASLSNDAVFNNGVQLTVDGNGVLPAVPIPGKAVTDPSTPLVLPPYSYAFVTFAGAAGSACK
jgi:hypothetical protein